MDVTIRQMISKAVDDLNNNINQLDLTDIYRSLYPTTAEYIVFSSAHGIFSRVDNMLGHKTSLGNF